MRKFKLKRFSKRYVAFQRQKGKRIHRLKNHPFVVPVVTFLLLFFVTAVLFITSGAKTLSPSDSHVVIVSHDGTRQTVPTRATTVGDLLVRLHVALREGDVVEPAKNTPILEDNFRVNVYRGRPVTIIDGTNKVLTYSAATTARSVTAQAGLTVYPEDGLTTKPIDNILQNGIGEEIIIDRATPVYLNLYGTLVTVRTRVKTVKDVLKEKNVTLAKNDQTQPALNTPITPNIQIFVTRAGTQIVTQEQGISSPTQIVEDDSLSFGTTAVRQQGSDGKKLVTYQVDLQNGKEVARHLIQDVTVLPPVPTIIARGKAVDIPADKTSVLAAAGVSSSDYAYANFIISNESGWCPTKWQGEHTCPAYYEALYLPGAGIGYGLCQSTPGNKMANAGADWQTSAVTQVRWCSGYASRYGGWAGAYNHWQAYRSW